MDTTSSHPAVPSLLERFNHWLQESVMIKLFSIGFLILILLIPSSWISDLIYERQARANSVMNEVASKWSGSQMVTGPVLVLPFRQKEVIDRGKDGIEIKEHIQNAYFLPESLAINGKVSPQQLQRGIFDAVVYESSLELKAGFGKPDLQRLNIDAASVLWKDAHMVFGISDLRGISENPGFVVGDKKLVAEPSNDIGLTIREPMAANFDQTEYTSPAADYSHSSTGITAKLDWQGAEDFNGNVSMKLDLKGSKRLDFVPAGKTTDVSLAGSWKDPSFDGVFIPEKRDLTENGFTASWKVLHFNRPFSQQWIGDQTLSGAEFGVKLLVPVDQYQKSMRTSKYGILVILLTFMALFLVEITQKIRIHPFQYILIGAALTIYYALLLSISEHAGYNIGYVIASIATVALVSLYSKTFLHDGRLVLLFSVLLLVFYTFIFIIILQQDFSLLIGSIGLFVIVAMLMYFSRKVSWYGK